MTATPEIRDPSPKGFSRRRGVSLSTTYKMIRDGSLRARKLYGKTIITEEDEAECLRSLPVWKPSAPDDHRRANARNVNARKRKAAAGA